MRSPVRWTTGAACLPVLGKAFRREVTVEIAPHARMSGTHLFPGRQMPRSLTAAAHDKAPSTLCHLDGIGIGIGIGMRILREPRDVGEPCALRFRLRACVS